MALPRIALCFAALVVSLAVSFSAAQEKYATDWITPSVKVNDELSDVCAIELELSKQADQLTGTITYYSGNPAYDQFGDADRKLLQSNQASITFGLVKLPDDASSEKPRDEGLELWKPTGDSSLPYLRLVLSSQEPYNNRVLITNAGGHILRVLPVQSEQLTQLSKQFPIPSLEHVNLFSSLFIGWENRLNHVRFVGEADQLRWMYDSNHLGLDANGDIAVSTLLGPSVQRLTLTDLELSDATGQKRRVYRCELNGKSKLNYSQAKDAFSFDAATLVLDPFLPSWHRLILMKQGRVERIIPMRSRQFGTWFSLRSQVTDAAEKKAFENLSQESPFFSGLRMKNGHVVSAIIPMPQGNERILDHLPQLARLADLEIQGDVRVGAPLEQLARLESLSFSHGKVSQEALQHVGRVANLRKLSFYTVRLDCRGLQHLSGLRELTEFDFTTGDQGDFAEHFEDACVDVISNWPKLKRLNLSAMPLSAAAVGRLSANGSLESVSFGHSVPIRAVFKYAKSNPKLKIDIGASLWSLADGFVHVPYLTTDDDLQELAELKELRTLELGGAELITDKGLAHLVSLKLKTLSINHNRNITDAGISDIAKVQSLEELNLWYCDKLTNASIAALKRLPNLKKVNVFGTKIDPQALKAQLPNCEIER